MKIPKTNKYNLDRSRRSILQVVFGLYLSAIWLAGCAMLQVPTRSDRVGEAGPLGSCIDYAEPPLVLKAPEPDPSKNFVTVAMESRTHYVQHLYPLSREMQPEAVAYSLADYG